MLRPRVRHVISRTRRLDAADGLAAKTRSTDLRLLAIRADNWCTIGGVCGRQDPRGGIMTMETGLIGVGLWR